MTKKNKKLERRGGSRSGAGRPPVGGARKIQITIGLPPEVLELVDRYAEKTSQSRSQAIGELLADALK